MSKRGIGVGDRVAWLAPSGFRGRHLIYTGVILEIDQRFFGEYSQSVEIYVKVVREQQSVAGHKVVQWLVLERVSRLDELVQQLQDAVEDLGVRMFRSMEGGQAG